jgi:hypothetical protein
LQAILWINLFLSRDFFAGPMFLVVWPLGISMAIFMAIAGGADGPAETAIWLASTFSILLACFSTLYWDYGAEGNFSITLSRLDAVYFAVGTLTTAGTGDIVAKSETARGIQTMQMVLGMALVVFAVTIVLARLLRANKAKPS